MMEDTEDREGLTTENLAETVMKAEEEDRKSNSAEIKGKERFMKSLENMNPFGKMNITPELMATVLVKILSIPVMIYTFLFVMPLAAILVLIEKLTPYGRFARILVDRICDYGYNLVESQEDI